MFKFLMMHSYPNCVIASVPKDSGILIHHSYDLKPIFQEIKPDKQLSTNVKILFQRFPLSFSTMESTTTFIHWIKPIIPMEFSKSNKKEKPILSTILPALIQNVGHHKNYHLLGPSFD